MIRQVAKVIVGALVAAVPGILIHFFVHPRAGIAVASLSALIGALLALPGVSLRRTAKLFLATMVDYNLPVSHRIYDWVDEGTESPPSSFDDRFMGWIVAVDVVDRRRRWIFVALALGAVIGGVIAGRDYVAIGEGRTGVVLPMRNVRDSLESQVVMIAGLFSVWTASAFAMLAAPAFRRPILVCAGLGGFIGFMIAYTVQGPTGPRPISGVLILGTAGAAFAILIATVISSPSPDDFSQDKAEPPELP
ncbi:MAG: hypothetical protein DWQ31_00290 [Planctomycetota bacterium]|nr:MAG: hypothetical protein DWQ31_00290 [Planctomycetota bacterium]REJ91592.1 MAG: hypothetical protein DWQ35_14095 [Planctomycetota bacterium]REK24574.1 MAG: hypothetical protein DWQ42_13475 [Planctomycetota bacterium]REK40794.1 MAG: hypothetical protein DWQ46_15315 [Planctomycetota bacterium]